MKTFVTTLIAGTMLASVSFAQGAADRSADALNARQLETIRASQVVTPAPAPARPAAQEVRLTGFYAGLNTAYGGADMDSGQWSTGATVGYNVNRFLAVEGTADYVYGRGANDDGQTVFINAVAGYPVGRVTPYVLAGTGWGFNGAGNADKNTQSLWNVGGGVAVNVTRNWQIDARYRYVEAWDGERQPAQVVGLGVNYRF